MSEDRDAVGRMRVVGKLGGEHPADGLWADVSTGGGAHMSIPNPQGDRDGGIGWRLVHSDPEGVKYAAMSLLESYEYLISGAINLKEATRRLAILRKSYRALSSGDR